MESSFPQSKMRPVLAALKTHLQSATFSSGSCQAVLCACPWECLLSLSINSTGCPAQAFSPVWLVIIKWWGMMIKCQAHYVPVKCFACLFFRVISSKSLRISRGADTAWYLYAIFFFSVSSLPERLLNWPISVRKRGKSSETVNVSEVSQFSGMLPHRNVCENVCASARIHMLSATTSTRNWGKNWAFGTNKPRH